MPKENLHIVHRQIVEAKLPTEEAAKNFQQRISQLCEKELPNMLDHLCNKLNLGNDLLRIPRMEIDIGTLPHERWEQIFIERCTEQLRRALDKKKDQAVAPEMSSLLFMEGLSHQQKRAFDKEKDHALTSGFPVYSKDTHTEDRLFTKDHQVLLSFFEFLRNGSLASSNLAYDFAHFENSIVEALRKINPKEELYRFWHRITQSDIQITERLGKQFSLPFLQDMVSLIWDLPAQRWQSLWDNFQKLWAHADVKHTISAAKRNYEFVSVLIHTMNQQGHSLDFEKVKRECMTGWKQMLSIPGSSEDMTGRISATSPVRETTHEKEPAIEEKQQADYFIENGGLVIAASFLPTLFRELKWVDEQEFLHTDLQEKAIQLTQYMATGEEQSPEFMLPLNKLLCGWPLEKPLIREIELTDKEKGEASDMLQAVIKHWGKIGQSSISALRETFLQRKATLRYRRGYQEWHLHIERKEGIDILVERIPWTLSIVKLPWMQERVQVEWV